MYINETCFNDLLFRMYNFRRFCLGLLASHENNSKVNRETESVCGENDKENIRKCLNGM